MAHLDEFLFSEEFLFEGEQAEAYKKRKAEEKAAKEKEDEDYLDKRWKRSDTKTKEHDSSYTSKDGKPTYTAAPGRAMTKQNPNYGIRHPIKTAKGQAKDAEIQKAVHDKFYEKTGKNGYHDKSSYRYTGNDSFDADYHRAQDARSRYARRHLTKESSEIDYENILI